MEGRHLAFIDSKCQMIRNTKTTPFRRLLLWNPWFPWHPFHSLPLTHLTLLTVLHSHLLTVLPSYFLTFLPSYFHYPNNPVAE